MKKSYNDGIITSLEKVSEYNIDSSMFEFVRKNNIYNLYLLVGNKRFLISTVGLIKPTINDETFNVIIFPFKYDNEEKGNVLVDEIDRIENILLVIPTYEKISERKIIKQFSKKNNYSKKNYELSKIENGIFGNFYIPNKLLKKQNM